VQGILVRAQRDSVWPPGERDSAPVRSTRLLLSGSPSRWFPPIKQPLACREKIVLAYLIAKWNTFCGPSSLLSNSDAVGDPYT